MKHTPGPWRLDFDAYAGAHALLSDRGSLVATVPVLPQAGSAEQHFAERNQRKLDAQLIAAAPELLACLRRMCGMYGAYSQRLAPLLAKDEGTIWTFERANSLALEAVAKAEGR